jgi:hypothetical protein
MILFEKPTARDGPSRKENAEQIESRPVAVAESITESERRGERVKDADRRKKLLREPVGVASAEAEAEAE